MAELRELPFTCEVVENTRGELVRLDGQGHRALAVFFPSKGGWDVTCSCDDPTNKTGKSRWFINGKISDLDAVKNRFQSHLSYFNRPKTRAD